MFIRSTKTQCDGSTSQRKGNNRGIRTPQEVVVMAIKSRKENELKVAGAKLPIRINGKQTSVWIDSGSPISIFTVGELKRT